MSAQQLQRRRPVYLVGQERCHACGKAIGLLVVSIGRIHGDRDVSHDECCKGGSQIGVWWPVAYLPEERRVLMEFDREKRKLRLPETNVHV